GDGCGALEPCWDVVLPGVELPALLESLTSATSAIRCGVFDVPDLVRVASSSSGPRSAKPSSCVIGGLPWNPVQPSLAAVGWRWWLTRCDPANTGAPAAPQDDIVANQAALRQLRGGVTDAGTLPRSNLLKPSTGGARYTRTSSDSSVAGVSVILVRRGFS